MTRLGSPSPQPPSIAGRQDFVPFLTAEIGTLGGTIRSLAEGYRLLAWGIALGLAVVAGLVVYDRAATEARFASLDDSLRQAREDAAKLREQVQRLTIAIGESRDRSALPAAAPDVPAADETPIQDDSKPTAGPDDFLALARSIGEPVRTAGGEMLGTLTDVIYRTEAPSLAIVRLNGADPPKDVALPYEDLAIRSGSVFLADETTPQAVAELPPWGGR